MVEIISLEYHLSKLLLNLCWNFQLKLSEQSSKVGHMHVFERRCDVECKLMFGVLIVGIGESLMSCVVSICGYEHIDPLVWRDLESLLPSVSREVLIEALDRKRGTVMTSKA